MSKQENTWGIILASHGNLAQEALNSAIMIAGPQEQVQTVGLYPGENLETLIAKYQEAQEVLGQEELLILTDLDGGTPTNAAAQFALQTPLNVAVFSGFTLGLILEILTHRQTDLGIVSQQLTTNWQVPVIDEVAKWQQFQARLGSNDEEDL
ncbi:PTS sugar transporter subunit IIA [Lactobacillus sp. DCY120]|uniref:PTS sugar transporter subunit IIA n=1 Tax=Bombilactobacillus apium TaxID=2675299 RepID=A0A850R3M8_9LACO|nr:PTS sugar transporter subunit IIA [Bombilactobacillus apium]NVY96970.1 PTS sugar transporter subunit IIA [Bombilactobacillus apium]